MSNLHINISHSKFVDNNFCIINCMSVLVMHDDKSENITGNKHARQNAQPWTLHGLYLASKYGVLLHAFADDNQLYLHSRTTAEASVEALERCIDATSCWISANRLCLNTILGILITPDLSLEQHIDAVCAKCFYQLRQLRQVRRMLDDDSIAILVHAFVMNHKPRPQTSPQYSF